MHVIRSILGLTVSTFVTAGAYAHDLADCGHYLEALATTSFTIDAPTQRDLNVKDLVAPVIAKHLSTKLGGARLSWLLQNSTVRAEEIRRRQNAVRFYVEHPNERARARHVLTAVDAGAHGPVLDDLIELAAHHTRARSVRDHVRSIGSIGAIGAVGGGIALGQVGGVAAYALTAALVMMGRDNAEAEHYSRDRIYPFAAMITGLDQITVDLGAAADSPLVDLRVRLARVLGATPADDWTALLRVLRRPPRPRLFEVGATFSLTNLWTAQLRKKVVAHQGRLALLASLVGELDVYVALAEAAVVGGHVFPKILDDAHPTTLVITDGHHPHVYAEHTDHSVPNSVHLSADRGVDAAKFLLLTGPNTGGKSTYLKMIASLTILAQMGGAVPAAAMEMTPIALMTNMTAQDELRDGQSFFHAQGDRVKQILDRAKNQPHVLILMDEILNGTSPEEHTAIERAIIMYMVKRGTVSILATHDRKLQALEHTLGGVVNIHVDDKLGETFRIKRGPSLHRNAIQVLREVGLPAEITDEAQAYLDAHLE